MDIKSISLEELERRIDYLRDNPTPAEILMKAKLNYARINYIFQYPIETKTSYFIADFYIPRKNIIVEIDGSIHNNRKSYDNARDKYIKSKGYKVIRIKNKDVDTFNTLTFKYSNKKKTIKSKLKKDSKIKKDKERYSQKKLKQINDLKYPYLSK